MRELNEIANWKLEIETEEELIKMIDIYQSRKARGELIEAKLANYEGKDKENIMELYEVLKRGLKGLKMLGKHKTQPIRVSPKFKH